MKGSVLTIGTFDGLHRGHQQIVKKACALAGQKKVRSVAITFDIPPRLFFFPSSEPALLTTVDEKRFLLEKYGIEDVEVLHFDSNLAKISAADFFDRFILGKYRAQHLVVGYNFGFGRNREGDTLFLEKICRKHSIPLTVVPAFCDANVPISSGRIRDVLRNSDLDEANRLLGYSYFVTGKVVRGDGLGKKIGFPTANLSVAAEKIIPSGVFAVRVTIKRKGSTTLLAGMCNIGFRPTVSAGKNKVVEAHLFDFSRSLYGAELRVDLIQKIRDEKKFTSLDKLKQQLQKDKILCLATTSGFCAD